MPADLIVYALVAAGLVFWLRNILGTRHGDERERPPVVLQDNKKEGVGVTQAPASDIAGPSQAEKIAALAEKSGIMGVDGKAAEKGLLTIGKADRAFDVETFLTAAQDAFVMIVEAFAEGDRETLGDLLSPEVYKIFDGALSAREKNGETQQSEIRAIKKAEIIEARLENKTAKVTVRFIAEEISVTFDKGGEVTAGHPDKVTEMKDIWVFGRDTRSRDPRWFVYETRGDFDGDNDLIPDSH